MSENHSANRKDDRADPNDDGGLLLGDVLRRFHSQVTAALIKFLRRDRGQVFSVALFQLDIVRLDLAPAFTVWYRSFV
jgi:hypothetical protein